MTVDKQRARRFGLFAETLCAWTLRAKGYRILARGYRISGGEIDIIARRGNTLAVVEVKARQNAANAAYALSHRQQKRITRVASAFIQSSPGASELYVRFDVMLVSPWRAPSHIVDAWRET